MIAADKSYCECIYNAVYDEDRFCGRCGTEEHLILESLNCVCCKKPLRDHIQPLTDDMAHITTIIETTDDGYSCITHKLRVIWHPCKVVLQ